MRIVNTYNKLCEYYFLGLFKHNQQVVEYQNFESVKMVGADYIIHKTYVSQFKSHFNDEVRKQYKWYLLGGKGENCNLKIGDWICIDFVQKYEWYDNIHYTISSPRRELKSFTIPIEEYKKLFVFKISDHLFNLRNYQGWADFDLQTENNELNEKLYELETSYNELKMSLIY